MSSTASEMARELVSDRDRIADNIGKVKAVGNIIGGGCALAVVGAAVQALPVHPVVKICGNLFIDFIIIDEAARRAERNWYGRR